MVDSIDEFLKEIEFEKFKGIPSISGGNVFLHTCCGPCSISVILKLIFFYKMQVSLYYYNPNIFPKKEYYKRRKQVKKVSKFFNLPLFEGPYENNMWMGKTKKLKNEPEGGRRCNICYALRLLSTAKKAKELGISNFTTTLSVSPHMDHNLVNKIGKALERKYNVKFIKDNFKKQNGFLYSVRGSKYLKLYRQNYCGCIYSKNNKDL